MNHATTKSAAASSPVETSRVLEHLFRREAGRLVATLTRIFGVEHLALAEDVVQEALVRALRTWPFYGIPDNPSAWIMQTARNLALDTVRREKIFRDNQMRIISAMPMNQTGPDDPVFLDQEIADDRLRMLFVCCHPLLPPEAQVALALKTLGGLGIAEISRAFLTTDAAIAKRLTRARQKIRDAKISFEIPAVAEFPRRMDGVLQTLYLLFNEGYKASSGEELVREELCREAIRLTELLAAHPVGNQPITHALLAQMLLNTARLPTRRDDHGNILLLEDQDRSRWDRAMIAKGLSHLTRSAAGKQITTYHCQAGIAACHCAAGDYPSTDWRNILLLYDRMLQFDHSPVVALNRAVVLANVDGPQAGLAAVASIDGLEKLESYYLLYAVRGELQMRSNNTAAAAVEFQTALRLVGTESEKSFMMDRLRACMYNSGDE